MTDIRDIPGDILETPGICTAHLNLQMPAGGGEGRPAGTLDIRGERPDGLSGEGPYAAEIIYTDQFGEFAKERRLERGLSEGAVARGAELTVSSITQIEDGTIHATYETANRIYRALGGSLLCLA